MGFKRHLTGVNVYFAAVSSSIGSGWLFAPFYAAKISGPQAIYAWLLAALLLLPIICSFCMMAVRFPVTGSLTRYTACTHGGLLSFMCGWLTWFSSVMVPAIETMATLSYSSYFFPSLAANQQGAFSLSPLGFLVATFVMLFFLIANFVGIKLIGRVNSIAGVLKVVTPFVFIITGAYFFKSSNFKLLAQPIDVKLLFHSFVAGGILFSITGFRTIFEIGGEIKNPKVNLVYGVFLGFLTSICIYFLLQITFIGMVSSTDLAKGWHQLTISGSQASPLMSIAEVMGLMWLVGILYFDAIISPASTGLINATSSSRVLFSIGAAGFLPKKLLSLNEAGVPWITLVLNFFVGMLFFVPFSGWVPIISFFTSLVVLNYALGVVVMPSMCLLTDGVIKIHQHVLAVISLFSALMFVHFTGWQDVSVLVSGSYVGVIIYLLLCAPVAKKRENTVNNLLLISLILLSSLVVSYLGEFSGRAYLNLYQSAIILFFSSCLIYFVSLKSALPQHRGKEILKEALREQLIK